MNEQVYIKQGRRYKPLGYSDGWTGFPADGVWLVKQEDGMHSSDCLLRLGEVQDLHPTIDLLHHKRLITNWLCDNDNVSVVNQSYDNLVEDLLKYIGKKQAK